MIRPQTVGYLLFLLLDATLGSELYPYPAHQFGSPRSERSVRDCHVTQNRSELFEVIDLNTDVTNTLEVKLFEDDVPQSDPHRYAYGHLAIVGSALQTLSFHEPDHPGSCAETHTTQRTVSYTSHQHHCLYATNGGFFDLKTGNCLGNLYSNGRLAVNGKGVMNPNFGILKNGTVITGYLTEQHVLQLDFESLVQGIIWLVRNGTNYVNESMVMECGDMQTTGTMEDFVSVVSARSAIGHDALGNVLLLHVEGKTRSRGINLYEFADLLLNHGFVNAINLDGGSSTAITHNLTLINYPSEHCTSDGAYRCEKEISSVICVHAPCKCVHGRCLDHVCHCDTGYTGESCDALIECSSNCSNHGTCHQGECMCSAGWKGDTCQVEAYLSSKELGVFLILVGLIAILSITANVYYCLLNRSYKPTRHREHSLQTKVGTDNSTPNILEMIDKEVTGGDDSYSEGDDTTFLLRT